MSPLCIGRDWTPEIVVVFGVKHGNKRIDSGDRNKGHEPCTVDEIEIFCSCYLAYDGSVNHWFLCQSEACIFGLSGGPHSAGSRPKFFDLLVVGSPPLTGKRDRGPGRNWSGLSIQTVLRSATMIRW